MHLSQSFSPITQTSQLGFAPAVVNRTAAANLPDKLANLIACMHCMDKVWDGTR